MRKINRHKLISIGERDTMHMVPERHTQVSQTFRCQTEWELEVGVTMVNIQVAFFFFSCLIWSFWFVSLLLFTFSETCLSLYGKFNWHISIRIDFYVSRSQLFWREEKWILIIMHSPDRLSRKTPSAIYTFFNHKCLCFRLSKLDLTSSLRSGLLRPGTSFSTNQYNEKGS